MHSSSLECLIGLGVGLFFKLAYGPAVDMCFLPGKFDLKARSLSANGWGCVPVLLVVWHSVSSTVACWSLSGVRS